ncbi:MAG: hypothetical protein WC716_15850 [Chitinophagaceae bacterium]|jgi:hypothetical protein
MCRIAILLLCIFSAKLSRGHGFIDSTILTSDFPVSIKGNKFSQRVSYQISQDTTINIRISSFYYRSIHDSLALYDLLFEDVKVHLGAGFIDLPFEKAVSRHKMHADFFEVISHFKMVPAGMYKTQVILISSKEKNKVLYHQIIDQFADTALSQSSGLRDKMNAAVALPKKAVSSKVSRSGKKQTATNDAQIKAAETKMKRQLRNIKGLDLRPIKQNGKTYSEAYYKGFLLGRYEMASVDELNERAANESKKISSNASSLVNNELDGFKSVGSQLKGLNSKTDREDKLKGILELNTYRGSAQDPQSEIEQNYTEFLGGVDVEVRGMPFSIEGFYTTQDANRKAKASYFRVHYDVESAKSKLQSTINGYKSKLNETVSKGKGLESVYGTYAKSLESQKESMLNKMAKEYDVDPKVIKENNGDAGKIAASIPDVEDTAKLTGLAEKTASKSSKGQSTTAKKDKLLKDKKDIEERYQKIVALEQKAEKYYKMLDNYRTQTQLDSAVNYKKMAGLDENGDASYKDMAKAASGILPEGKTKNFITGLTSFDAGIINKYESDYTMAGQTMKGLSFGYDLGICKTGVTLGSTEYVSREGNVDHYSSMLIRVDNKGSKNHKLGFLYNVNTPARSMGQDDNFIGQQGVRYPSFNTPTQIFSVIYDGKIGKYLVVHSEVASSYKKTYSSNFDMAHSALNNSLAFMIPKTSVNINAAWEHLGHSFENNALPYIRSGTERYTIGTSMDLFKSFLSVKVDYNFLLQENFAVRSYNRKWGFEMKTHSKRYPSVSLSYKPFSTFRSLSDTLQIAQRPIQGEVWTARAGYQIKRNKKVHRFTVMYNQNSSTADTINYTSSTAQLGYMFTTPAISVNANVSRVQLPESFADGSGVISSYILGAGISKNIGKSLSVSLSPDVAFCDWGTQRISATAGMVWRMERKPLTWRLVFRYSNYKLSQAAVPMELYAGQLGLSWQFKTVRKPKNILN